MGSNCHWHVKTSSHQKSVTERQSNYLGDDVSNIDEAQVAGHKPNPLFRLLVQVLGARRPEARA